MSTKTAPAKVTDAEVTEPKFCGCGCEQEVSKRATFRPGHDARHAGNVGRALAANAKDKAALAALAAMSDSLRAKAERVRDNAVAKAEASKAEA